VKVLGSPFTGRYAKAVFDYLLVNAVLWLVMMAQVTDFMGLFTRIGIPIWYYVAAGYAGMVVFHQIITTRDGWVGRRGL
jgi:hypothetical protein